MKVQTWSTKGQLSFRKIQKVIQNYLFSIIFSHNSNYQYYKMKNQSDINFQQQQRKKEHKIKFKHSTSRIQADKLNEVENNDFLLSRILCLHHIKTAFRYICDINNDNIVSYNRQYDDFITNTKLREIAIKNNEKGVQTNMLLQAFKLEKWSILLIFIFSLMAAASSIVIIYYQQTLAKYIITKTPADQYKWFGIIVGNIVFRFLIFNYLMALTNNVALNIKVGLQNLFMRAIFFLDYSQQQLNMHKMRFLAIQQLIQAIIFVPYTIIALGTIIGVVVLIFNLNNYYGFIFFGIFMLFFIIHLILLLFVFKRLRRNQAIKDEVAQESKWVFRSLLPLIFDRISKAIVERMMQMKDKSLKSDRFYNFCYSASQFLADTVTVVSIIIYYGLNHDKIKDMTLQNTYLSAVYLGMLYYPFKVYVYGSYAMIRGFQQYYSMIDNFRSHVNQKKLGHLHLPPHVSPSYHSYPDNIGGCFHYKYEQDDLQQQNKKDVNLESLPSGVQLNKHSSNTFIHMQLEAGQTIMTYFNTNNKNQVQRYIKELINSLPYDKTVVVINENNFVLPQSFKQNIIFYSEYNEQKFHQILKLVELDYFIPEIEALQNNHLNYRISKYYAWHECRLQLARALYNNVDYLIINKYIVIQDTNLLKAVISYRNKKGKITYIANNWHVNIFSLADKLVFFQNQRREVGTYQELSGKEDSILNNIKKQLQRQGKQIQKSEEVAILHQNFLALVNKKPQPLELKRTVYFQFFNFAHFGGGLVVLLALMAPVSFKVYMNWLIGQTVNRAIYPDILTFGVIYLFFTFIRGLILSFYFRQSSFQLFSKIVSKHRELCGDQILNIYKEKDDRIENDFKKIDCNLVICFELGMTVMLQSYGGLIIVGIGQAIVLAMAVPLIVLTAIVNALYNRIQRKLLILRQRYQQQIKIFINHCTTRALAYYKYGKYQQVQDRFNQMHRINIIFACNQMWVLSGMRMVGQIVIIISVIVFLVIMIETQSHQISNLLMVSYGVSLFVNMNFSYRFNLKTYNIIQTQMLALTKCINFFKQINQQSEQVKKAEGEAKVVQIDNVETIQFKDINIEFGSRECQNINLKIFKGDRISVSADSKSLVTLPFYLLRRRAFSRDHVKGEILINQQHKGEFDIKDLFFMHFKPLLPSSGTVFDICLKWKDNITRSQCAQLLNQFFKQLQLLQVFNIESSLVQMNIGYQQILSVFRAVKIQKCKILVMISSFDYLDILTRIKIEKYLIGNKDISIVISITNNHEITRLYKRNLLFREHHFVEDQISQELQVEKKKV